MRDIQGTYSRSFLGFAWIFITPLGVLAIYWVVFAYVLGLSWPAPAKQTSMGYALPFFCGLVPYLVVAEVMSSATRQFEAKRTLVAKASFPLLVIPTATWIRSAIVAAPALLFLIVFAAFQVRSVTFASLAFVAGLGGIAVLGAGLALLLSSIGAFFGDLQHAMQLILRILFYSAPISYPLAAVPEWLQTWLLLNPLTPLTELIRTPLLYGTLPPPSVLLGAFLWPTGLLLAGWFVFNRVRRYIPDVV